MEVAQKNLIKQENNEQSNQKIQQEKIFFINPKAYYMNSKKSQSKKFIMISSIIIIIFIIILKFYYLKKPNIINNNINNNVLKNNYKKVYSDKSIKDSDFYKYEKIMPHLTNDSNDIPSSIEDIFNARQIYISDAKITPEYIKYIRPINETEEEKYKKSYFNNKTIIDINLFKKRDDQYNYIEFGKLALKEKLIDNKKIEYDNKPIISIVVPYYNKKNILLKSIRSIQNQNFQNIEIIIVNDCSTDKSDNLFNYLLKTDPRIRIFHHTVNLGCWRTRIDGIIYSRGKYIILFDPGDLYEDNYVLSDAYNVIEKYHLDSCKFLFRIIRSLYNLHYSVIFFHVGQKAKIVYESKNIFELNHKVFRFWGNIWNRLVRANIFIKALLLLNELVLNIHKNVWDDVWFNKIIHRASYSYAIFERIGYVYLQDGYGAGSPKARNKEELSKIIKEYVGFLSFKYNFAKNKETKHSIIKTLRRYNSTHRYLRLQNFREHFEVLNELLETLIKDRDLSKKKRNFCKNLLKESKIREKEINKNKKK